MTQYVTKKHVMDGEEGRKEGRGRRKRGECPLIHFLVLAYVRVHSKLLQYVCVPTILLRRYVPSYSVRDGSL